jgi:hypothetical protein
MTADAGPSDAESRRDAAVPWRIFVGIAVFMALIAVVYWFVSYEDAGTVMLALASGLALLFGGWLFLQDRRRPGAVTRPAPATHPAPAPTVTHPAPAPAGARPAAAPAGAVTDAPGSAGAPAAATEHPYLPEASVWPFVMGLGALVALNGLILSWAYAVPGAALLVFGVVGFVAQGRRRELD